RRGVELTPNEEVLVRRLITLLDRHGDRAGALEAYEEFAVRLREEYDAQPAAETQDLIAAVRARERAAGPAPRLSMDVLPGGRAGGVPPPPRRRPGPPPGFSPLTSSRGTTGARRGACSIAGCHTWPGSPCAPASTVSHKSRSPKRSASWATWRRRSATPTAWVWCTATSSRRTFCWKTATPSSRISGSPGRSRPRAATGSPRPASPSAHLPPWGPNRAPGL